MDYSRWMSLNPKIHDKKLAGICLPMTHDTGTFDLSNVLAPNPEAWLPEVEAVITEIVKLLNKYDVLPKDVDPLAWAEAEVIKSLKGLATATKQNVATQLRLGMRGFDFRMFNNKGTYYCYHGLVSTSTFGSMLDDVASFLIETTNAGAAQGEIVYLNMSHYLDYTDDDLAAFGTFVKNKFGDYVYRNTDTNNPFNATYKEIIGQGGTYRSRVILVSSNPLGDSAVFWPKQYCPPDDKRT